VGADPAAEVAAEQDRLAGVGPRAGARGSCQLRDRLADLDFMDAGCRGAADGDQRGPGRRAAAGLAVPARPAAADEGRGGEAFDVLDERRAAAAPPLEGAWRRRRRAGIALVDEVDRRRLLAGDVCGRGVDDPERQPDVGPLRDRAAEREAGGAGLRDAGELAT